MAIIDSGRVTQWKKNPTIYFLKGYRKVALELNENGEFEESKKYQATSEEEKAAVRELLEEAVPTDSLKEKENDHFYRVEFNENDPEKGLKSYGGEIVTFELIDQLKTLKDAAFIEDPQHNQVILKGKSYGKEIQTALPSEEFALGNPFRFSLETVSEVAKRKNEIYYEQQLSQKERV